MQRLETKDKGSFWFKRTWIVSGVGHIGLLADGGYIHVGGAPITKKRELTEIIPPGPDRDAALAWFENKDKPTPETPRKKIVIEPDGKFHFDDGSEVMNISDLVNNLPPGPVLEMAMKAFALKQNEKDKASLKKDLPTTKTKGTDAVAKIKAELEMEEEKESEE